MLEVLRKEIDRIDDDLIPLLLERMDVSKKIAEVKRREALAVEDPGREETVLQRAVSATDDPRSRDALEQIYRTILAQSRKIQVFMEDDASAEMPCADGENTE